MKTFLKKTIALACFAMLMPLSLLAQDVLKVHGIVTDPSGEPLIGVNVKAGSSSVGAVTDLDGKYSIEVLPKSTLTFSYVGFETVVESVKNRRQMDVTMKESSDVLNEVVVIGYGAVKKSDLTSSIATVKGDEITETVTGNAMDALQGKVNGVQVTSGGGPGATRKVLIRGVTTVNGTNPLYVVDGMPVGDNINFLNSNDIASMEVLKDASAAAIYGTRASNGVILITTKKGKIGRAHV